MMATAMELTNELLRMRAELDKVTSQRDLLLCEVANLRRELEISELKNIGDNSFLSNQKDEEGAVSLQAPDNNLYSNQQRPYHGAADTGYMEGNRYVASAHHRNVTAGLNHSNSSCSSTSNTSNSHTVMGAASTSNQAPEQQGSTQPPMYIQPPEGFGMSGVTQHGHNPNSRYEMSQDLLDKQTEILERRYGGYRARRAAITIQRAFRRRQLLKKFSAITAMAKAADARRHGDGADYTNTNGKDIYATANHQKSPGAQDKGLYLTRPMRSMSLRERNDHDGNMSSHVHIRSTSQNDIEAMAARVQHSANQLSMIAHETRNDGDSGVCSCSVNGSATNISTSSSHNDSLQNHHLNNSGAMYSMMNLSPAAARMAARRLPPEVPKRTSSINMGPNDSPLSMRRETGASMTSVQSSGSDSSCQEHHHHYHTPNNVAQNSHQYHHRTASGSGIYDASNERYTVWKRQPNQVYYEPAAVCCQPAPDPRALKVSETVRKRQYRVGLNLFNKKPERGIGYLISRGFLENSPRGVARFLITRKGLSKQMIGEYLGNLQNPFNMAVLENFVNELDLSGMQVDVALRRYQTHFRLPGEAQKIERLVEAFSRRYCQCNPDLVQRLRTHDTIFVLAFAIIMLNTDLHTPNLKPEARMSLDDFVRNLRGIDDTGDIDRDTLAGIYERVKTSEFRPGSDHVTQVMKVQTTIVGKKPHLALPHRRLVCYCRLYEIPDIHKKERPGVHQREVFLFNDLLVITKIFSKKKSSVTYSFRLSFPLSGLLVNLFSVPHYPFGIRLSRRVDGKCLATFNARNEHDRCKFAEDLRESVAEMDEMETMRIEGELSRGKGRPSNGRNGKVMENRDSGVADIEIDHQQCVIEHIHQNHGAPQPPPVSSSTRPPPTIIKRSVLSNSLVDINDPVVAAAERLQRRGSVGSLDSGMSISFTHAPSQRTLLAPSPQQARHNFLGGIFPSRQRKMSAGVPGKTTEVVIPHRTRVR